MHSDQVSKPAPCLWRGVFELGYVTNDIEHALKRFRETHGFTGFEINRGETRYSSPIGDVAVDSSVALGYVDSVLVEIIQPHDWTQDNIYTRYLDTPVSSAPFVRFHHLGFNVGAKAEFDALRLKLEALPGSPVIAVMQGQGVNCIYQDDRMTSGHLNAYMSISDSVRHYMGNLPRN